MPTLLVPPVRGPHLRLVCINDVYTLENLPRLRSLLDTERAREGADLLLTTLAGDFVAPSMLSSLDAGRGMIDCLNALPVTHVCLGNHEDDIPPGELAQRIEEFRGVWLSTNVPFASPRLRKEEVLELASPGGRSVKIGLLGVVMTDPTVYRGHPFGGVPMLDARQSLLDAASHLLGDLGCSVVLPLTHQTIDEDRRLAQSGKEARIPVVIGGHEHQVFLEDVGGTWIVKAGSDAVHAVVVDLEWPAEKPALGPDVPQVTVALRQTHDYPEDPELRARVDNHLLAVKALSLATLKILAPGEVLSSVGTRYQETSLGTLVCCLVRDSLGAEGCIFNGGGIRGSGVYETRFTYGDLEAEVPFDNDVVVARIPGHVMRRAIAESRSHAPLESGGYLHVDDRMTVVRGELIALDGKPLEDHRSYRIALVRNLFEGMDHNTALVDFATAHPSRIPSEECGQEIKQVLVNAFALELWKTFGGFEEVDVNHDGTVTAQEIAAALRRSTGEPASDVTVDLLIRAMDTNLDRTISAREAQIVAGYPRAPRKAVLDSSSEVVMSKEQQELITKVSALLVKKHGDTSPANMRKLFDSYDKNHDQKISGDELEALLKDADIGNAFTRSTWIKGIIEKLDQNGDKLIDWDEFSKAIS